MRYIGQIRYAGRPWTLNHVARSHWRETARNTKDIREAAFLLWRDALGPPRLLPKPLLVSVQVRTRDRRKQDTAACVPLVKACIDALIDGGYIEDDTPDWVAEHRYYAPTSGHEADDTLLTLYRVADLTSEAAT